LLNKGGLLVLNHHSKKYARYTVTIPADANGYAVTRIAEYAFSYLHGLSGVIIPNTVKEIGEEAFASTSLTSVTIPNGVTRIGNKA